MVDKSLCMRSWQPVHDSNVIYFESKEALEALVEKGAVLAKFHQTWCGHCKTMKKVCVCECVYACGVPCCHSVMQKSMREWLCMSLPRKGYCVCLLLPRLAACFPCSRARKVNYQEV